jgi:hypothetical protein
VTETRAENEKRLAEVQATITTELQDELEAFGAGDPVKVKEKRRALVLSRVAALRHTGKGMRHLVLVR